MKAKLNILLLVSVLALTATQAAAQPSSRSSSCLLPGAPPACTKYLPLSLGSVYSEELITNFPSAPVFWTCSALLQRTSAT